MRLILFRHGPAGRRNASRWPDDGARPLTSRGEQRTREAATGLARSEPEIRLIVTSPLARAAATARLLAEALGECDLQTLEALRPGGSWRQVITHLATLPMDGSAVVIGHEPDLGKLAGTLVFGAPSPLPLKKAGACAIDFAGALSAGSGQLAWLMPPRFLRRLAGRKHKVGA